MTGIKFLYEDLKKKLPESIAVLLASVAAPLALYAPAYGAWDWIARIIFAASVVTVIGMILMTSSKGMHYGKRILFSTIIITVLLALSIVHAITTPIETLFSFSIGSDEGDGVIFDMYIAPIFLMTLVAIFALLGWRIAQGQQQKSKQIKGIKGKDLFR